MIENFKNGSFIVMDKPIGMTSHDVVDRVRNTIDFQRVGHSGTLDKNVSGVLVIGIGPATRLLEYLLESPKEYICTMKIHSFAKEEDIQKIFCNFTGKICQIPPVRSSVKRVEREREVYELTPLEFDKYKNEVTFIANVEKGTYIRKLCHDMGERLGTGAHMKKLRRTKVGPFTINDNAFVTLEEFERTINRNKTFWKVIFNQDLKQCLLPANQLVDFFPKIQIDSKLEDRVCNGICPNNKCFSNNYKICDAAKKDGLIRILNDRGSLVGMGVLENFPDDTNYEFDVLKINKVFPGGI